ncbi:MAG: MqnA/MqnD/SBP family protein [Candidatus Nezhaarchaeales archaeon]
MGARARALAASILVFAAFAALAAWSSWAPSTKVRVALAPLVAHLTTYAYLNGYVQGPEGVELEVSPTLQFNLYLMSGWADVGEMSTAAFAIARERGIPLKIVSAAVVQGSYMGNALVFVKRGSDIASPSDLRGRTIAVHDLKATTTAIFLSLLEKDYGVGPEEVSLAIVPLPQMPEQLWQGRVDAALAFEFVAASMYLDDSRYSLIWDVSEAFKRRYGSYPVASVIVAREELLRERPWVVGEVLGVLRRSLAWSMSHLDEVASSWVKEGGGTLEQFAACLSQFKVELELSEDHVRTIATIFHLLEEAGVVGRAPTREEAFAELVWK